MRLLRWLLLVCASCSSESSDSPSTGADTADPLAECIDRYNGMRCEREGETLGYCACGGPLPNGFQSPGSIMVACCRLGLGRLQACTDIYFDPHCPGGDAGRAPMDTGSLDGGSPDGGRGETDGDAVETSTDAAEDTRDT